MTDLTPNLAERIDRFIDSELNSFQLFAEASARLGEVKMRSLDLGNGVEIRLTHNPARRRSSGADLSASALAARPCFLCSANRPAEQHALGWGSYDIVVNPYPVVERHLTIVHRDHRPQQLDLDSLTDFAALACALPGRITFYNGAKCGASAPDHLHFQSVPDFRPPGHRLYSPVLRLESAGLAPAEIAVRLQQLIGQLPAVDGEAEPRFNLAALPTPDGSPEFVVIPRRRLRPLCFSADPASSAGHMVSPATLEMLGLVVTPLLKDFEGITPEIMRRIYDEVQFGTLCSEPRLSVGIMSAPRISVRFHGRYLGTDGKEASGRIFTADDLASGELIFTPGSGVDQCRFELDDVTIGKNFHWQRLETQSFAGSLLLKLIDGLPTAINLIGIESYLKSVVSSEMNANASQEFLKAHAVISRSWALAQLRAAEADVADRNEGKLETPQEVVRWMDRDNHTEFDLCADDHCQRYQGIGRITSPNASAAVAETRGEVLLDRNGAIADARFSKCCGGRFELFSTCWQPRDPDYLVADSDIPAEPPHLKPLADFSGIAPDTPLCDTRDTIVLDQVLNSYDRETPDFYRWRIDYPPGRLEALIRTASGIDFGEITALEALHRGPSGRISRLRIIGTKRSIIVGKELEIRRWLSETHLKSSAFEATRNPDGGWTLLGKGWGHGVGLCQIGAAMMAARGYDYRQILAHYFPGTIIAERYGLE